MCSNTIVRKKVNKCLIHSNHSNHSFALLPRFLSSFVGNTEIESALKACIALMNKRNINEGKSLILKEAHSKLNYACTGDGKFDCYGSENSAFLCLLSHIWKMQFEQKCTSSYSPNSNTVITQFQTTFSVPCSSSKLRDIDTIFPIPGDIIGYCRSEFHKKPPKEAPQALTDRMNGTSGSKKRVQFYECRGNFQVYQQHSSAKTLGLYP